MATCVATLKYLKGNFKRHDREEEYLYDALALTQRTGEKQQASPMELGQKIKQETVKIIYNVVRCSLIFKEALMTMYSEYRHFNAGWGICFGAPIQTDICTL
eukprot:s14955_g1.t1